MTPKELAAEAWDELNRTYAITDVTGRKDAKDGLTIIQAAIEKVREPLLTAIKTAINENDMMPLFMALDKQDEIRFSRAEQAGEHQ